MKVFRMPIVDYKMREWQKLAKKTEISLFGEIEIMDNETILVKDVIMLPNEGTSVTTEIDNEILGDFWERMFIERKLPPRNFFCHIHTHPGFGVTPSGTDTGLIEREWSKFDFFLSGIFDGDDEWYWQLNTFKPFRMNEKCETELFYEVNADDEEIKREFNENFTEKKSTLYERGKTTYAKGYSSNKNQLLLGDWVDSTPNYSKTYWDEKPKTENFDLLSPFVEWLAEWKSKHHHMKTIDTDLVMTYDEISEKLATSRYKFVPRKYVKKKDNWVEKSNPDTFYGEYGFTKVDLKEYLQIVTEMWSDINKYNAIKRWVKIIKNDIALVRCEVFFEEAQEALSQGGY